MLTQAKCNGWSQQFTCAPWYSTTFSPDDYEALEARGAVESPGEPHSAPSSAIKVLKLHPGTPTVNHKWDSKVAEMEGNIVLQNHCILSLYCCSSTTVFFWEKLPFLSIRHHLHGFLCSRLRWREWLVSDTAVASFQVCWQTPSLTLLCRRVWDGTAASEAPIQSQVWPFKLLRRCFSSTALRAHAQTLSSHVISSTPVNKEQAPGFLQVASAIGLYYKLATEKGNCIGGLVFALSFH